jgi:uncharacterized C2H2 Zn-finger protein
MKIQCNKCNKIFKYKYELQNHNCLKNIKVPSIKKIICEYCDDEFKTKKSLKKHLGQCDKFTIKLNEDSRANYYNDDNKNSDDVDYSNVNNIESVNLVDINEDFIEKLKKSPRIIVIVAKEEKDANNNFNKEVLILYPTTKEKHIKMCEGIATGDPNAVFDFMPDLKLIPGFNCGTVCKLNIINDL